MLDDIPRLPGREKVAKLLSSLARSRDIKFFIVSCRRLKDQHSHVWPAWSLRLLQKLNKTCLPGANLSICSVRAHSMQNQLLSDETIKRSSAERQHPDLLEVPTGERQLAAQRPFTAQSSRSVRSMALSILFSGVQLVQGRDGVGLLLLFGGNALWTRAYTKVSLISAPRRITHWERATTSKSARRCGWWRALPDKSERLTCIKTVGVGFLASKDGLAMPSPSQPIQRLFLLRWTCISVFLPCTSVHVRWYSLIKAARALSPAERLKFFISFR